MRLSDARQSRHAVEGRIEAQHALDAITLQGRDVHLGVGDEPHALRDERLEAALRVDLVRVRNADELHGRVGVDEDHIAWVGCGGAVCLTAARSGQGFQTLPAGKSG